MRVIPDDEGTTIHWVKDVLVFVHIFYHKRVYVYMYSSSLGSYSLISLEDVCIVSISWLFHYVYSFRRQFVNRLWDQAQWCSSSFGIWKKTLYSPLGLYLMAWDGVALQRDGRPSQLPRAYVRYIICLAVLSTEPRKSPLYRFWSGAPLTMRV